MLTEITPIAINNMANAKSVGMKQKWLEIKQQQPVFASYLRFLWREMKASKRDKRLMVIILYDFLFCINDELYNHAPLFYTRALINMASSKVKGIEAAELFKEAAQCNPEELIGCGELGRELGEEYLGPIYTQASRSSDYPNMLLTALYVLRACKKKNFERISNVSPN